MEEQEREKEGGREGGRERKEKIINGRKWGRGGGGGGNKKCVFSFGALAGDSCAARLSRAIKSKMTLINVNELTNILLPCVIPSTWRFFNAFSFPSGAGAVRVSWPREYSISRDTSKTSTSGRGAGP